MAVSGWTSNVDAARLMSLDVHKETIDYIE